MREAAPGPWRRRSPRSSEIQDANGDPIADLVGTTNDRETIATGDLIAAAPDLLAALEEAADKLGVAQLQGVQGIGPMLTRYRRLIAAAHQGKPT